VREIQSHILLAAVASSFAKNIFKNIFR